jgi:CheY-like chemotaxis protein
MMIRTISPTIQETMQNFGYRVIAKTYGRSALSVFDEDAVVDLVSMDYMMPV